MNVDTGEFRALSERVTTLSAAVAELGERVEAYNRVEKIMARAGMPQEIMDVAGREAGRTSRHLRLVPGDGAP